MNINLKIALFADHPTAPKIDFAGKRIPMGLPRKQSERALLLLLEAMVNIARMELRMNRLPPLYRAGVRYVREENTEDWKDPVNVFKDKEGDCEDLSIWRVAELRNNHKKASPYIRYRVDPITDTYIYHVLTQRASGRLEDPSLILGMGSD